MSSSNHFDLIYGELFGSSTKINDSTKPTSSIGESKPKKGTDGKEGNKKIYEKMLKKRKQEATDKPSIKQDQKSDEPQISSKNKRALKIYRKAGNEEWQDETLADWPDNDYRIYCCNLGNEVSEEILTNSFSKYTSFAKCKVIKDKKTDKGMGYGFVSLLDCDDYVRAMREMQGKYVGNRPIKLLPSKWTEKSLKKGFGVIKQGNAANLMAQAKGEDCLVFE